MSPARAPGVVRAAASDDVHGAAVTAALGLAGQSLAARFVDHVDNRVPVLTRVFTLLLEHALQHGHVDVLVTAAPPHTTATPGKPRARKQLRVSRPQPGPVMGVAVWLSSYAPPIWEVERRLMRAAGWDAASFVRYVSVSTVQHRPYLTLGDNHGHHQLALLAVHPDHQGAGHADALLEAHHQILRGQGQPAYVEAPGPLRAFFTRHGYHVDQRAAPFDATGHVRAAAAEAGTTLTPMWRSPASAGPLRSTTARPVDGTPLRTRVVDITKGTGP